MNSPEKCIVNFLPFGLTQRIKFCVVRSIVAESSRIEPRNTAETVGGFLLSSGVAGAHCLSNKLPDEDSSAAISFFS